jgi:hypothetical protein
VDELVYTKECTVAVIEAEEGGVEMFHLHYRTRTLVPLFAGFVTTLIVLAVS